MPINATKEILHAQLNDIIDYNIGFFSLVLLWSTVSMPTEGDFKALIQAQRVTIHNKNLYEVFGNKQLFCTALFILFISVKIICIHKGQRWYSGFSLTVELISPSQALRIFKEVFLRAVFHFSSCQSAKTQRKNSTPPHLMISCFSLVL